MDVFLVGGAVRDYLLGKESKDRDFVVVGASEALMRAMCFSKVGDSFPVFLHPVTGEEYALARTEKKNGTGYNGFEVDANSEVTLEEDLARRDLTINSIAASEDLKTFHDPFGGIRDLQMKVLRHTSEAFADDPLRVVRLARFYARYKDFSVAQETLKLAVRVVDSGEMDHITDERYWAELEKVISDKGSSVTRFFDLLKLMGVFEKVKYFSWARQRGFKYGPNVKAYEGLFHKIAETSVDAALGTLFVHANMNALPKKCTNTAAAVARSLQCFYDFEGKGSTAAGAKAMLTFLRMTNSLNSESPLFNLVMMVVSTISYDHLEPLARECAVACASVKGEMFDMPEGPELGKAIHAERLKRLEKVLTR